jgi:peptidoglycan hydrolase CwlO-like protein
MENQPRSLSVHIPVALLALAISIFLFSQIGAASRTGETIKWQLGNLDKGLTELKDGQKQLDDLIEKAKPIVEQGAKVQENYTKLLKELLELAKTDKDAQAVVEKWKIQVNEPAPAAATPDATKPAEPKK